MNSRRQALSSGNRRSPHRPRPCGRSGVATIDYILVLGVIMPLLVIVVPQGMRIVRATYEMICVMIAWPFL